VAGNRKTFTWAAWVKRSTVGSYETLFGAVTANGESTNFTLGFEADSTLIVNYGTADWRRTTATYTSTTDWIHLCVTADTPQATPNNRLRIYVDGIEITAFGTNNPVTQNADLAINNTIQHLFGNLAPGTPYWFSGLLGDIYLIDGQMELVLPLSPSLTWAPTEPTASTLTA
jgi:hypothetical protein